MAREKKKRGRQIENERKAMRRKEKEIDEEAKNEEYLAECEEKTSSLVQRVKSTYEAAKTKFYTISASAMQVLLNFQCKFTYFKYFITFL